MEVKSFNSPEEMMDYIEEVHKRAYDSFQNECTEGQKALKVGDIFISIAHDIVIFNKIQPFLEEEDEREFEFSASMGYVFVEAWSNACPEGEMGSVHRSRAIAKIVDTEELKAEHILEVFTDLWSVGDVIDHHDLQWIVNNLEDLTSDDKQD
jgi:hypothetical protein